MDVKGGVFVDGDLTINCRKAFDPDAQLGWLSVKGGVCGRVQGGVLFLISEVTLCVPHHFSEPGLLFDPKLTRQAFRRPGLSGCQRRQMCLWLAI